MTEGGIAIGQAFGMPLELLDIKQMAMVYFGSGIAGAVLYLKKSPLPSITRKLTEDDDDVSRPVHPYTPGDPLEFIEKPKEPPK